MITEYIEAAMRKARYEFITGERVHFGKIPGFKGLWASGLTKSACKSELRERLDEWIVLSLRMNMSLPVLRGLTLNKTLSPVKAELVNA
jgi:hypothetical protein